MKLATFLFLIGSPYLTAAAPSVPDSSAIADSAIVANSPVPTVRTPISTNPDISAIGDFRSTYSSPGPRNVETYFNQLEVQLTSVVDPYARANFLFSFGKDSLNGEYSAGLEVATLTTIDLPYSLEVTLGKFKPSFTAVNTLHPHAFSFVEFPSMIRNFFGDEGLFMEGISASILVPNPWDFFQELKIETGRSESVPSLDNGADNRLLFAAHLRNYFDLSDNASLNVGFSGLTGPNAFNAVTSMAGIDLTYKWKPVRFNTYRSFTWQAEAMVSRVDTAANTAVQSYGAYTFVEYQIEKRTFAGVRFDYAGLPGIEKSDERTASLLIRFQPSEFQIFALEFQTINRNYAPSFQQVVFRAIFGIGAHAAHAY